MTSTEPIRMLQRRLPPVPKVSVSEAIADATDIARTAIPADTRSTRLFRRSTMGLGRELRGTDQAMFCAFCSA